MSGRPGGPSGPGAAARPLPDPQALAHLVPPEEVAICFGGGGDFLRLGLNMLRRMVDWADLRPTDRFLDVGCGAGRAAVPLTHWLDPQTPYLGFDVFALGLDWCRDHITPRHPNFRFERVDVLNRLYNPAGRILPRDFTFPCADAGVDLVLLNSVFTHMLPEDMVRYLHEIARVLAPGGRAYLTWFLLDEATEARMRANPREVHFTKRFGPFWVQNVADMEEAVAYDRAFALGCLAQAGLTADEPRPGHWPGKAGGRGAGGNFQDVIVAWKP
ncbi:MAG: class I SAM-dependent methyltransferase [Desulfovibrionaceae bacterium]